MNTLLAGVVGSTAYGLNTPNSDVDRLGVFAAPTAAILGLRPPKGSIVTTRPDVTMHEAGKLCGLLLSCNPTVLELLWLPGYETVTPLGRDLVGIRAAFLGQRRVRDSYLGYARGQLTTIRRILGRPAQDRPAAVVRKHARHAARLLIQGRDLYLNGVLPVRLSADDAVTVHELGEAAGSGDLSQLDVLMVNTTTAMHTGTSPLRRDPDEATVQDWLLRVRAAHWTPQEMTV